MPDRPQDTAPVQDAFSAVLAAEILEAGGLSAFASKLANNNYQIHDQNLQYLNGALQFAGQRDVFLSGGWKAAGTSEQVIAEMAPFYYKRVGTASTIIRKPPQWTWRRGLEIRSGSAGFQEAAAQLINGLQLIQKWGRADKLSRIGRYGLLLLIHTDSALSGGTWGRPVGQGVPIVAVRPIMEASVTGVTTDNAGETIYKIKFGDIPGAPGSAKPPVPVHASRVVHIVDNQDESGFYGTPTIMPILNELDDLMKISASSGEAFWRYRGTFILQQLRDKDNRPVGFKNSTEREELTDAFRAYFYGLYSTMILSNVEPKQIADEPIEPTAWQDAIYQRIAVGLDWPKRILVGSETGERSSTEDLKQWASMIESRQLLHATPQIVRPTIDAFIRSGQLADPGVTGYTVYWPSVLIQTDEERSIVARNMAEANAKQVLATGEAPITNDEIRAQFGLSNV